MKWNRIPTIVLKQCKKVTTLLIRNWQLIALQIIISLLIILFIYTGLNKLMDYDNFTLQLGRSPYIEHWVKWVAIPLPVGELLIATALIFPRTRLIALYASLFVMALFTGYVWVMMTYSPSLPCTCGGILQAMSWHTHLIFNAVVTVLSYAGIFIQARYFPAQNVLPIKWRKNTMPLKAIGI